MLSEAIASQDAAAELGAAHRELTDEIERGGVVNMSPCGIDPQNADQVRARAQLIR